FQGIRVTDRIPNFLPSSFHRRQLPKPSLWAQPGLVMAPGANITLWCSRSKLSSLEEVTFTLWKAGTQGPLQQQTSADLWTSFLLPSVRPEDTGSYSCTYWKRRASARGSEPSEALELLVPGSLPKPSLSAIPGLVVEPGMHVTLQCRQPPQTFLRAVTFVLLKVGTPQPLQSQSPAGTSADFPLLSVRAQDAGDYSCVYHRRMAPHQVSEPSEVLEIWVTGEESSVVSRKHQRNENPALRLIQGSQGEGSARKLLMRALLRNRSLGPQD
uniref:Ig-like domain-containing protein n=1 Tax=Vombatus ursinus TaxID=29139 RepID=A0A4X2L064_VOMUR